MTILESLIAASVFSTVTVLGASTVDDLSALAETTTESATTPDGLVASLDGFDDTATLSDGPANEELAALHSDINAKAQTVTAEDGSQTVCFLVDEAGADGMSPLWMTLEEALDWAPRTDSPCAVLR